MKAADGDTWDPLVDGEEHPLPGATPRPPAAGSPAQPPRQSDTDPGPPLTVGEGRGLVRRPGHRHLRNPLRPRTLDEPSGAQTGSDEPREKLASEIPAALSARKVDRGESGRRDERNSAHQTGRSSEGDSAGAERSRPRTSRSGKRGLRRPPGGETEGLSWLVWVLVGFMIITLGIIGLYWARNHSGAAGRFYDPIRSIPEVREIPDRIPVSTLQISPPGYPVTVESQARHWEVRAAGADWNGAGEAAWAGLEAPPKGTHWIAVAMDIQDRAGTQMGPWVDFTFHFAAEDGRQFAETQCWNHCLATAEGVEGRFIGYLFFLVPNSVSDAGYIVVTPLLDADIPFALRLQPAD